MGANRTVWSLALLFGAVPIGLGAQEHHIAFNTFAPRNTEIFVADAKGGSARVLFPDPALDYNASFSADGEWVVFTSERGGSADIYRGRVDGSRLERLVDDPAFDDQAALSPDGRSLAFVSSRGGQADLWVLDLETGRTRNVIAAPASGEFRPSWSPDGTWIAFSSDRDPARTSCANATAPGGPGPFITPQYTALFVVRPDGSELRRVTAPGEVAGSPVWSQDGSRLLYYSADPSQVCTGGLMFTTGTSQIASVSLQTGDRTILTTGDGIKLFPRFVDSSVFAYVTRRGLRFVNRGTEVAGEFGRPAWSPDGHLMVFHREAKGDADIRAMARPSPDPRFALSAYSDPASFSPDGKQLVLMGINFVGPVRNGRLIVASADGSTDRAIFDGPSTENLTGAVWSPLGDGILFGLGGFFQSAETRGARLMLVRPDGTGLTAVTSGATNDGMPSWSPDGKEVVFRVAGPGRRGLYILTLATGERRKLETGSDYDTFPFWSPRGDWITFTSNRDGDYEIYRVRPDGTGVRRLTRLPGSDAHSSVSPDGEWVAFATSHRGFKDESHSLVIGALPPQFQAYGEIAVMRIDGSELRVLTDNSVEDGVPIWRPR
jgi:Tol biopolymer transport system component